MQLKILCWEELKVEKIDKYYFTSIVFQFSKMIILKIIGECFNVWQ